ncbi:MAG TPA: glycosyltransferase family 39 protein [Desulfobacteria bacterium]|nr:glycosyltransferase family 39 protein [Desulfobacteria bacterium]
MDIEKRVIIEIIAIILAIKFFSFLLASLAWLVLRNQPCDVISLWNWWDAPHYVYIAENGYTSVGEGRYFIVFMPLYPLLIRLVASVLGNYEVAALVISNLASLFAGVYLYRLAKLDYSHSTALKSVFYYSIFPTSYFLIAGYTESLFLLLAIGCFYYARKAKWLNAGVMGMLASATRITGLVLLPSLLYEYFSQHSKPGSRRVRDVFFIALVSVGFVSYLIVNHVVFGDAFAFLAVQHEHWFKHIAPPWEGLLGAIWGLFWRDTADKALIGGAELVFGLVGFFCIAYAFVIKLRPSYTVYMLLTWLAVASTSYWLSMPRYLLSLFPLFIVFALIADKREEWFYVLTTAFLLFFSFFLVLFTQGYWAF